ncbi:uncharacterized protein DUF2480 [Algoriphagus ratkowskyi]|uniref:DUF2480 family protein n=1 Tax=Algoriphagus ratkowskyi TaxID=57028 RepID=A0A2W7SJ71_9BACT|nr:DUF2480 family protein [Algoriphagus ratkowskyi]PZX50742.1 uncharacterized protein DUF2480 [Algoriphagus ratkowskyi]TXD75772.1 DUF2480 family protein [Algoriphagus ratkowskyi]
MSEIINRVASSPIITLNLEDIYPREERVIFDLTPFLFQELVLKEKDFRLALKEIDWLQYKSKWVAITCTADAIVPNWAFMLVATYINSIARGFAIGNLEELEVMIAEECLNKLDLETFADRPVVVKGCSNFPIPLFAYGKVIALIQSRAKSIMYGEPCSTVPLYKKQKS